MEASTTTKGKAESEPKAPKTTNYLVFVQAGAPDLFRLVREIVANGPEQAVRNATESYDAEEIDCFAAPSRNWTFVPRRVEQRAPIVVARAADWKAPKPSPAEAFSLAHGESDPAHSAAGGSVRAPETPLSAVPTHPADAIEED